MRSLENKRKEFFENVWDHSIDPFQISFDERRPLTPGEHEVLNKLLDCIKGGADDIETILLIRHLIEGNSGITELFLRLSGLTRNKILTDLKASDKVRAANLAVPSSFEKLHTNKIFWREAAGPYLWAKLKKVFSPLVIYEIGGPAFEAVNQATASGFIRQERAKRSGHHAEGRLASVLAGCGIFFVPVEKADNPMCRDVQIHDVSFDLAVPTATNPLVVVKSTVHTSNIGQYGESKDALEIVEAKAMIERQYSSPKPVLMAFIDGVGFASNAAGLDSVLSNADEFCQFKTIWKFAVICAHKLNKEYKILLPDTSIEKHDYFLRSYCATDRLLSNTEELVELEEHHTKTPVDAGEAKLIFL